MEPTDLRKQFFAETLHDPYAHMVADLTSRAWAMGYDQALRDAAAQLAERGLAGQSILDRFRMAKDFHERCRDGIEYLTDHRREAQAQAILAMAGVGRRLNEGFWPGARVEDPRP